ncbi:unnamed protein product [Oreochromis niloticus]|nr:unnamed protein product [Mustela putorius furo]
MLSLHYWLMFPLFLITLTGVSCDQLTAVKDEESTLEGNTLTLSYRLSRDIIINDYFFWYRQYPGKPPEFLIHISGTNNSRSSEFLKSAARFSTKLSGKNHLDLQISSAAVTDSAVYYCAVRPTVTGNTKTLYKNLWSKDNRILHNIH